IKNELVLKKIASETELVAFYSILCENLGKYNVKPVHTLEEVNKLLHFYIKDESEVFGVYKGEEMIAGGMLFYFQNVKCAHTQYLAAKQEYNSLSPMTYLYYSILEQMKEKGFSKVSWGTVTEDRGKVINLGLVLSKESYGGEYCNNFSYYYDLCEGSKS
ncbi:MAG: GNAT family N-acetyltransferase, partial [Eubacteriales bacterium]|nr:GNAT family N-acetyltransferase [Eubacteriales bacterium]